MRWPAGPGCWWTTRHPARAFPWGSPARTPSPSFSPAPVILKPFETYLRPVYGPEPRPDVLHEHKCSWHVSPGGVPPFGGSHLRLGVSDKPEIAQEVPPRDTPHFL